MAYRLRYQAWVDWVGPGMGPMGGTPGGPGMTPAGPAQTIGVFNTPNAQNSAAFEAGDITNLTNAMAADVAAQLTALQARIQGFATGGQ